MFLKCFIQIQTGKSKIKITWGFLIFLLSTSGLSQNYFSIKYRIQDFPSPHMLFEYPSLGAEQLGLVFNIAVTILLTVIQSYISIICYLVINGSYLLG